VTPNNRCSCDYAGHLEDGSFIFASREEMGEQSGFGSDSCDCILASLKHQIPNSKKIALRDKPMSTHLRCCQNCFAKGAQCLVFCRRQGTVDHVEHFDEELGVLATDTLQTVDLAEMRAAHHGHRSSLRMDINGSQFGWIQACSAVWR